MKTTLIKTGIMLVSLPLLMILGWLPASACSRLLWHNSLGTYVGRNEDWYTDCPTDLWVLPRGMNRDGAAGENSYKWKSKYGSLVVTMYENLSMSGVNEAGLSAHVLWLEGTKVAPRDPKLPGLSISIWMQWYLDNFATVKEAVEATEHLPFQIRMAMDQQGTKGMFHISVEDSTGDSGIFEIIDGQMKIYHDRRYVVMTNQPSYDKQLAILSQYAGFGGTKPLPGTLEPADRLARGAFYVTHLPDPKNEQDAIATLMSVMRTVGQPVGMPSPERAAFINDSVSRTIFRLIINLNKRVFYFDRVYSPAVFWVKLQDLDFREGAPVKKLSVNGNNLAFDVTKKFTNAKIFTFVPSTEATLGAINMPPDKTAGKETAGCESYSGSAVAVYLPGEKAIRPEDDYEYFQSK